MKTIIEPPVRRGAGAPKGNRNAVKHGLHTAEMRALRSDVRMAVQKAKALAAFAWNGAALSHSSRSDASKEKGGDLAAI